MGFEQSFTVELADIDTTFGLKETAVFKYYQETFSRYCATAHIAGYDLYQMGLKWIIGQTIIRFTDIIPVWNEKVTAHVAIHYVKKLRFFVDFEIKTSRGQVATGQTAVSVLDIQTSKPQLVGPIISHFHLDETQLTGEVLKNDFCWPVSLVSENSYTISFADIDYNNHTNNIAYIALCFAQMPPNYLQQHRPQMCHIRYLQETFLNDTVICAVYQNGDYFEYKLIKASNNTPVCEMTALWQAKTEEASSVFKILNQLRKK